MMALFVVAAGWVLLVVALTLLLGVPVLIGAGVVMMLVGVLVDVDALSDRSSKR